AMTDEIGQPNGIAFAPDGRTLYVTDASAGLRNAEGARAILAFAVRSDGRLGPRRTFAEVEAGVPDGLAVDADGRVYAACVDGIRVFASDGRGLGRIATATDASNVAFGGGRLFITAGHAVHAIDLKVGDGALRG
ncbi:MAG TPA: SMP-30/gluconolactonase/LRE family protein, partial [Geminicoccaceae bacterium]